MSAAHHARRPLRIAGSWLGIGVLAAVVCSASPLQEPVVRVQLLDNSDFSMAKSDVAPDRVPLWRTVSGRPQVEFSAMGSHAPLSFGGLLELPEGASIEQPLAFPPELVEQVMFVVIGEQGELSVHDDRGAELRFESGERLWSGPIGSANHVPGDSPLVISLGALEVLDAAQLSPRLTVRVQVREGGAVARFAQVEAFVSLACPSEAALRSELITELEWILGNWFERGLDRVGPRETAFLSTVFDCKTGAGLMHLEGGAHPFYALLGRALQVHENAEWSARYDAYLKDLFELGFQPETGLPRVWNVERDVPDDETPREIAYAFGQLLDIVEDGPEAWRERALAQAVRIGEVVLERGVLPDGEVAARYRPRDGEPNTSYPPLRRLDVPCELARLGALTGDDRYTDAARDAFAQFEFTHFWPGTWDAIDPGFDDNFGHYAARAVKAWQAHPDEPAFRNVAEGGTRHYLPIWRDALQLGGNIAADQVRCWKIIRDVAALEPALKPEVSELLRLAARNHFKGQQYADGTWGDVTIYHFDPKAYLEVGDLPGIARNLAEGLAFVYEDDLGLATDEQRALFTAVFRSSRDHYQREFGYLSTRIERTGANPAGGGVRLAAGMVEMLHQLGDESR